MLSWYMVVAESQSKAVQIYLPCRTKAARLSARQFLLFMVQ